MALVVGGVSVILKLIVVEDCHFSLGEPIQWTVLRWQMGNPSWFLIPPSPSSLPFSTHTPLIRIPSLNSVHLSGVEQRSFGLGKLSWSEDNRIWGGRHGLLLAQVSSVALA